MDKVLRWLGIAVVLTVCDYFMTSVHLANFKVAIVVALLLGIINFLMFILTLPLSIITLGLFSLFINAISLEILAYFIDGFTISSFFSAIIISIILSILVPKKSKKKSRE